MSGLIYAAGVLTGAGLMLLHQRQVARAVEAVRKRCEAEAQRLRRENAELRADGASLERTRDCADAFRRGVEKGRSDPMTDAERFARNFENRRAQFKAVSGKGGA